MPKTLDSFIISDAKEEDATRHQAGAADTPEESKEEPKEETAQPTTWAKTAEPRGKKVKKTLAQSTSTATGKTPEGIPIPKGFKLVETENGPQFVKDVRNAHCQFLFSQELKDRLFKAAKKEGKSANELINEITEAYLNHNNY